MKKSIVRTSVIALAIALTAAAMPSIAATSQPLGFTAPTQDVAVTNVPHLAPPAWVATYPTLAGERDIPPGNICDHNPRQNPCICLGMC